MGFLLFLIIPLLLFVVVDTFASLNVALFVALLAAIGEFAYSYFISGELDSFSFFSLFLLLALGGLSYFKQSRQIFYLKPAILSFAMGGFLLICYLFSKDIFLDMLARMTPILPPEKMEVFETDQMQKIMKLAPLPLGISSLLHGLAATYSALKLNRWGWFVVAGLGSYFFLFIGILSTMFLSR